MMKKVTIYLAVLVIVQFVSCKKYQIEDVKLKPWTPVLAAPLVNSIFGVDDIFEHTDSSRLQIDENGVLGIVYSGTIFSFAVDDIISVGGNDMSIVFPYPNPGYPIPVSDTVSGSQVFLIDFDAEDADNIQAHELAILDGFMDFTVISELAFESQITITIPHATKNGQPFQEEFDLSPGETKIDSVDMSGYLYDLTQENLGYNQILYEFQAVVAYDPDIPAGTDFISIAASFDEIEIDYMTGYFGINTVVLGTDTIEIDLFDNTLSGQFQFVDPNLKFKTTNSFGFPILVDVTEFKSINLDNQTETDIYLEGITDVPFIIDYPTVIGDSVVVNSEFTNQNSNIEDILNNGSKKVIWGLNAVSNPNGPPPDLNFLSHESEMVIQTEITVPLKGYTWDWVFTDTLEIDVDENPDELLELTIRLILDNGFPADGTVQVYLADSLFQLTDSLFDEPTQILYSGLIDAEGIVIQSTKTITDIFVEGESINNLTEAKHLIFFAGMESTNGSPPDNQVIEIREDYTMGLVISLKAKVLVDPDNL
jgi:hypothetical protein